MNNSVFGKTMENIMKYRGINLVTTGKRRNYLVSLHNYGKIKYFSEMEMSKCESKVWRLC